MKIIETKEFSVHMGKTFITIYYNNGDYVHYEGTKKEIYNKAFFAYNTKQFNLIKYLLLFY